MNESLPLLTAVQQAETVQRIMHDAYLLRGGAVVDAAGRLVLHEVQIDELLDRREVAAAEEQVDTSWVVQPITSVWRRAYPNDNQGPTNAFQRAGFETFRDVLMAGTVQLREARRIGPKVVEQVIALAEDNSILHLLADVPTPAIAEQLFDTPGSIKASVLNVALKEIPTLDEIIHMTPGRRLGLLYTNIDKINPSNREATMDALLYGPERFIAEFWEARNQRG